MKFISTLYRVKLGLGRLANNHPREYLIGAKNKGDAYTMARMKYRDELRAEIGEDHPIWGKSLNIESCEPVNAQ